jgi:serine/threonine-protein phosphatase PGAM5
MKSTLLPLTLAALLAVPAACPAQSPMVFTNKPDPNAPGTRVLYLVRHGYYENEDPADERVGKKLTALGKEQARLAGVRLRDLGVTFDTLRTSTFTRAMESGDIIAREIGLPVLRDSLISECTPPSTRPDIKWDTPGEADSAQAQLEAAWAKYARPSTTSDPLHQILVCHGNVIRWFVTRTLGVDTRQWAQMEAANGGITVIAIRPDGTTRLLIYDEIAHIQPRFQTWAGRGPGWPGIR